MKTLELEQLGVQEMDSKEMKTIDGGVIGVDDVVVGLVFVVGFLLGFWGARSALEKNN